MKKNALLPRRGVRKKIYSARALFSTLNDRANNIRNTFVFVSVFFNDASLSLSNSNTARNVKKYKTSTLAAFLSLASRRVCIVLFILQSRRKKDLFLRSPDTAATHFKRRRALTSFLHNEIHQRKACSACFPKKFQTRSLAPVVS